MNERDRNAILSRRARLVALSLAGAGVTLGPPAGAQAPRGSASALATSGSSSAPASSGSSGPPSPQDTARAKALFQEGVRASDQGNFLEAAGHFEQAIRLISSAKLLAHLVRAFTSADRPDLAAAAYERYEGKLAPSAEKDQLAADIAQLHARLALLVIVPRVEPGISADPPRLYIDGIPMETLRVRLLPGEHKVEVHWSNGHVDRQRLSLSAGETREVTSLRATPTPCLAPPQVCLSAVKPPPPVRGGGCGCGSPGAA